MNQNCILEDISGQHGHLGPCVLAIAPPPLPFFLPEQFPRRLQLAGSACRRQWFTAAERGRMHGSRFGSPSIELVNCTPLFNDGRRALYLALGAAFVRAELPGLILRQPFASTLCQFYALGHYARLGHSHVSLNGYAASDLFLPILNFCNFSRDAAGGRFTRFADLLRREWCSSTVYYLLFGVASLPFMIHPSRPVDLNTRSVDAKQVVYGSWRALCAAFLRTRISRCLLWIKHTEAAWETRNHSHHNICCMFDTARHQLVVVDSLLPEHPLVLHLDPRTNMPPAVHNFLAPERIKHYFGTRVVCGFAVLCTEDSVIEWSQYCSARPDGQAMATLDCEGGLRWSTYLDWFSLQSIYKLYIDELLEIVVPPPPTVIEIHDSGSESEEPPHKQARNA